MFDILYRESPMPEIVEILEDRGIVLVRSFGDVSEDQLRRSLGEVSRICSEKGYSRVFVDARDETSLPPTLSLYRFGTEISRTVLNVRFAVVVSDLVRKDLRFLESVTRNRGMQVRMFDSADIALEWLDSSGLS